MKPTFKIYSASAGSGKTYTLAKSYIKLLITAKSTAHFQKILAITFTNKAVAEMKTRIIDMLKTFSTEDNLKSPHTMFTDICEELSISHEHLKTKSKKVLNAIIHNYGAFDISTIDGFTHRVIRTFAFDLKLPVNFEVELDQNYLLNKAVDALIAKAGTDKQLTKTLVDFAIEKADDDKSWDISRDFESIGKLVLNENDIPFITKLKDKTFDDFKVLKTELIKKIKNLETKIVEKAEQTLQLINEAGLEFGDFSASYLPKHFLKLQAHNFNVSFDTKWQIGLIEGANLYPKKVSDTVAQTIDGIQPQLIDAFTTTKQWVFDLRFNKAVYKNITPLSVINALQKELQTIKQDENKLLISEFNTLISNQIKDQPTPFIYERLGEKFRHYFVDEFQDTSNMQWSNLIPLMDNALSSNEGSTMLVGDAKQSIYRWRGGDAEQFINLYQEKANPFQAEADVKNLDTNFRSYDTVVNFNNSVFNYLSETFFDSHDYEALYNDASQKTNSKSGGYVNLYFLEFDDGEERSDAYVERTYDIVKTCIDQGYELQDISVLVRKKKEGISVSDYLTSQNINIVSSETLLLNNSPKVKLLNATLALLVNPEDEKLKLEFLNNVSKYFEIENKHTFFLTHLNLKTEAIFKKLNALDIQLNYTELLQLPIYEMAEHLVRSFKLCEREADAYVQFYLDTVLDYSNKKLSDVLGFLEYFESKSATLSIAMPSNLNAVSIMTIHKSKGLEFPVVIFPFADLDIYREIEAKTWFPLNTKTYNGFSDALISYNSDVANYGDVGEVIYNQHQSELQLDGINLLYVTLTRAIEQLYIVSKKNISAKAISENKSYASIFINYLTQKNLWDDNQTEYTFGESAKKSIREISDLIAESYNFISTPKETHKLKVITSSGILWETEQETAIAYGNLLHLVMSKIETKDDIDAALKSVVSAGQIQQTDVEDLKQIVYAIVSHDMLSEYFSKTYIIYNEKDIITTTGQYLRPDRLAIKDNNAIIIDYKTGNKDIKHADQLDAYASVLKQMQFNIEKKLIVYTDDTIQIVEVK